MKHMPTLRKTGYNSTLAVGRVSSLHDSLMVAESSVLRTILYSEKAPINKHPNVSINLK
jgi:hypothetical protein